MNATITAIHQYWFGELDANGLTREDRNKLWFQSTAQDDATCQERFGNDVALAVAGELQHWANNDEGLVALVLLLDQFTRTIYRDTPQAFAGDPAALTLAQQAIDSGRWQQLPNIHRVFMLLPLEHSENLADQARSVTLFNDLSAHCQNEQMVGFARYAQAHYDVIAQFGRFPHRNAILGRSTTPEEQQHLEQHGGF